MHTSCLPVCMAPTWNRWGSCLIIARCRTQAVCLAGGEVVGADSIEAAFATGKGHITLRGIATVEQEGLKAGTHFRPAAAAACGAQGFV